MTHRRHTLSRLWLPLALVVVGALLTLGCNRAIDAETGESATDDPAEEHAEGHGPTSDDPTTDRSTTAMANQEFDNSPRPDAVPDDAAEAVFAGGCFWCVEAVFEELDGVYEAVSGYAGGSAETANYKAVASGKTKHAEVVKIYYDPERISFETLLEVHFLTHDPTTKNRQGADVGPQYRSAIFYADEEEKKTAEKVIAEIESTGDLKKPIVTTLEPLEGFWAAEEYHQNFVCRNPFQGYVQGVALPKVKKVRKLFEKRLKKDSKIPVSL